jgi:hypothetical protein
MIPIEIDTSDLAGEFGLSTEEANALIDHAVKAVTAEVARNWADLAKKELKNSREEYIHSLVVADDGPMTGKIILKGQFPNAIEQGMSPFDMKPGFEGSPKVHMKIDGKGGWYLTVPFRHAVPGSLGESSAFSAVMPAGVYAVAKKLKPSTTNLRGGTNWGASVKDVNLPKELAQPTSRAPVKIGNQVFEEYKHKSSIYAGMVKMEKFYAKGAGSSYASFRRVSDKSDPDSWIHRGITAHGFAEKAVAMTKMDFIIDRAVDEFLVSMGY